MVPYSNFETGFNLSCFFSAFLEYLVQNPKAYWLNVTIIDYLGFLFYYLFIFIFLGMISYISIHKYFFI